MRWAMIITGESKQGIRLGAVLAAVVLLALALAPACVLRTAEVGPNPARLTVVVKARVPEGAVRSALTRSLPFAGFGWWGGSSYDGPYWTLWARLINDKGEAFNLPTGKERNPLLSGVEVDAAYRFQAPPGRHKLRFTLTSAIDRHWIERIERYQTVRTKHGDRTYLVYDEVPRTSRVVLLNLVREVEVNLKSGQAITLRPFEEPSPGGPGASD